MKSFRGFQNHTMTIMLQISERIARFWPMMLIIVLWGVCMGQSKENRTVRRLEILYRGAAHILQSKLFPVTKQNGHAEGRCI